MLFSRSLISPQCSTPPSNVQPSYRLPGPAHFHTPGECWCKELPKRSLSSSVVSCILLMLNLTSFLQNPALPGSIPEAGSSCQAVPVILPVSPLFPSIFPAVLAASTRGVSNSTQHSCLQFCGQTAQMHTGHSHAALFLRSHWQVFPLQNRYRSYCSW